MLRNIKNHKITSNIALILIVFIGFRILVQTGVLGWLKDSLENIESVVLSISAIFHAVGRDPKIKNKQ
jgi:hypothetical protein